MRQKTKKSITKHFTKTFSSEKHMRIPLFLFLIIIGLSGCTTTEMDVTKVSSKLGEKKFPPVSIVINDGYVSRDILYTGEGALLYEDRRPLFIYNVIEDSGLFAGTTDSFNPLGYVLDIEYEMFYDEEDGDMKRKMVVFALTGGLLPQKHAMQFQMKINLLYNGRILRTFQYKHEDQEHVTILNDIHAVDKRSIKLMLNNFFEDLYGYMYDEQSGVGGT